MSTSTYTVTGMTCDHCVRAVQSEVSGIDGVDDVTVDLDSGRVTIESSRQLTDAEVAAAVEEAGYEIAS